MTIRSSRGLTALTFTVLLALSAPPALERRTSAQGGAGITVRLGAGVAKDAVDGRLLLLFAKDTSSEPRFQISATSFNSAQVFGLDVDGMKAGDERTFDAAVLGYPTESLSGLPSGEYTV